MISRTKEEIQANIERYEQVLAKLKEELAVAQAEETLTVGGDFPKALKVSSVQSLLEGTDYQLVSRTTGKVYGNE